MYSYFKGILTERGGNGVVVECGGVGYDIQMGQQLAAKMGDIGQEVTCYIHFHLSQDNQQLFGFPDKESRELFRLLITVNGIGPKAALAVLEVYTPAEFAIHVMHNDAKALQQVKGLGKKSAERIILELRDKFAKSEWGQEAQAFAGDGAEAGTEITGENADVRNDILEGLAYLGYSPAEAKRLLELSFDPEKTLEENLKAALASGRKT